MSRSTRSCSSTSSKGASATGPSFRWETEGWTGTDELRLQFRSEGERLSSGRVEDGQQELFVAKPISTFWNVQVGGRYDLDSAPGRAWGAIGIEGIAPRFFHVIATAYAGEKGAGQQGGGHPTTSSSPTG